jgi:hypothetical protein
MALVAGQASFERYLPLHFANEVLKARAFGTAPEVVGPTLLALWYGLALLVVAVVAWSRRVGLAHNSRRARR